MRSVLSTGFVFNKVTGVGSIRTHFTDMTKEEKEIREELERLYPQLLINCEKTCGAAFKKHGGDLLAVAIEMFLSKPIEKQIKVMKDGKMEHFITFIMGLQLKSGSSHFYHYYRKHNEKQRDFYDNFAYGGKNVALSKPFIEEDLPKNHPVYKCLKHHTEKLNPYEKMLLKRILIDGETYASISERYNISYTNLSTDSKKLQKKLQKLCKKYFM